MKKGWNLNEKKENENEKKNRLIKIKKRNNFH